MTATIALIGLAGCGLPTIAIAVLERQHKRRAAPASTTAAPLVTHQPK